MKKFYNLIVAIFLMATVVVAFPTGSVRAQGGEPLPSPQPPSFRPTLELNIPGLPEGYSQIRPVAGGVITGRYYQPYLEFGLEPHHTGVDFGIACGSPVNAVADGWVILSRDGWKAYSGWVVAVYHGYDPNTKLPWLTWYVHMATSKVEVGQKVISGQKVGTVGTAGTGCHLHWAASNKLPKDFAGWYEHASERKDKLGWVDPLKPPQYLIRAPLPPGIKPVIGDEDPVPPTDPGDNSDSSVGLIATLDKIADAIRIVPGLKVYAELWDKYKEYLPWLSAILVVLLVITVLRPFIGWLGKTRWGRRRDRKKKQFFWLWLLILLVYLYRRDQAVEDLLLLEMFKYVFGVWAFFVLSGILYRIWRHFNYDAEIEKTLEAGGGDRWEGLREVIIAPVIYGVLVLILAWTFGYFWGGSQIDASGLPIPVSPPVEDPVAPLPVIPPTDTGDCQMDPRWPTAIQQWCGLVTKYSVDRGLPPDLVAAVILQESGGDPKAKSSSQACGLMQIVSNENMMRNAQGRRFFANRPSCEQLYDPEFNISWGTKHLRQRIDLYGGIRNGLKSYGPMDQQGYYANVVLAHWQKYAPESYQRLFVATGGKLIR